jgi:predicted transcriptional regulator
MGYAVFGPNGQKVVCDTLDEARALLVVGAARGLLGEEKKKEEERREKKHRCKCGNWFYADHPLRKSCHYACRDTTICTDTNLRMQTRKAAILAALYEAENPLTADEISSIVYPDSKGASDGLCFYIENSLVKTKLVDRVDDGPYYVIGKEYQEQVRNAWKDKLSREAAANGKARYIVQDSDGKLHRGTIESTAGSDLSTKKGKTGNSYHGGSTPEKKLQDVQAAVLLCLEKGPLPAGELANQVRKLESCTEWCLRLVLTNLMKSGKVKRDMGYREGRNGFSSIYRLA